MEFISQEHDNLIGEKDKNKIWISVLSFGENITMVFEWLAVFLAILVICSSINLPFSPFVNSVVTILFALLSATLVVVFITFQKIAFYGLLKALKTKTIKDDFWQGILTLLIALSFGFISREGDKVLFVKLFSYKPIIQTDYKKDERIRHLLDEKRNNQIQRDNKIGSLVCSDCEIVRIKYESKINAQKKQLRQGSEQWVVNTNKTVTRSINALENEKSLAIQLAQNKFQSEKQKTRDSYDVLDASFATTHLLAINQIDTANIKETTKKENSELAQIWYAGIFAIFTQLSLFFIRWAKFMFQYKAGNVPSTLGEFMAFSSVFDFIINPIVLWFEVNNEKNKIRKSANFADAVMNVGKYSNKMSLKSETRKVFIESGVTSFGQAKHLSKQIESVNTYNDDIEQSDLAEMPDEVQKNKSDILVEKTDNSLGNEPKTALPLQTDDEISEEKILRLLKICENLLETCQESELVQIEKHILILNKFLD